MLASLVETGFLQKDNQHSFSLGIAFLEYGQLVSDRLNISEIALPIMKQFRDKAGEAINLSIRDRNEAIYIEKVDTLQPVRLFTKVGRRSPLYAGACSRTLLAFLPEEEIKHYLEKTPLISIGKGTITDYNVLMEKLNETRTYHYAISHSELENDTSSVAAPIFDHNGTIAASISVAGPDSRFTKERYAELIEQTKAAAAKITELIGGQTKSFPVTSF